TSATFTAGASYTALAQAGTPTIGFRGATSASSSGSVTSLSLSRPSATVANDVMLASVTARASSGTPTITATGWTAIVTTSDAGTHHPTATFRKAAGPAAAAPGPYTFSSSSYSLVTARREGCVDGVYID